LIFEKEKLSMSRFTTFGLTILLAFAPAALAADGTVLINQSTITNGLTGCPTGGHLPIVICQPGSYRLSGNVTVPDANTDAIHINADNVTLDLNGFAILGPATCTPFTFPLQCSTTGTGTGILSINNNHIGVSNGAINGMGSAGIRFIGNGARIDGLRVANNAGVCQSLPNCTLGEFSGGIIAEDAVISNCTVTANAEVGIFVALSGTVNQNIVSYNGGFGIAGNGDGSLVASNNSVFVNGQDGMNNVTLAFNNSIRSNKGIGFSCLDTTCSFEGNVFLSNAGGATSHGTSLGHNSCNGTVC
jgi:hypothetical protein